MYRPIVFRQIDDKGVAYFRRNARVVEQDFDVEQVPRMLAIKVQWIDFVLFVAILLVLLFLYDKKTPIPLVRHFLGRHRCAFQ